LQRTQAESDERGTTRTTVIEKQQSGDGRQASWRQVTITRGSSSGNHSSSASAGKNASFKIGRKVTMAWLGTTCTAKVVVFGATE
jgi:hypothetical protein